MSSFPCIELSSSHAAVSYFPNFRSWYNYVHTQNSSRVVEFSSQKSLKRWADVAILSRLDRTWAHFHASRATAPSKDEQLSQNSACKSIFTNTYSGISKGILSRLDRTWAHFHAHAKVFLQIPPYQKMSRWCWSSSEFMPILSRLDRAWAHFHASKVFFTNTYSGISKEQEIRMKLIRIHSNSISPR